MTAFIVVMIIVIVLGAIAFFSIRSNRELKNEIADKKKKIEALNNEVSSLKRYIEDTGKIRKEVSDAKGEIAATADSAVAGIVDNVMQNIPRRRK